MSKVHTYIIGEIGQNHNGSVDIAKLITELVARPVHEELFNLDLKPMDAVKMTKRNLKYELSASQMKQVYSSPHSFGRTYGEHREALELSDEEHFEVYKYAKEKGLDFIETLCAPSCLSILKLFTPDSLKVASRDLTNLPLIEALAETHIPIIISTGMGGKKELDDALEVIAKRHSMVSILHCISQYPTHPENINLLTIKYLQECYPQYCIGFSDHSIGISTPIAAVALGARIIEKHITIDRKMKGTDQAGSLGPDGVNRMIRDIRLTELSLGNVSMDEKIEVKASKAKLERSIASARSLKEGNIISENDIQMLSPGDGYKWSERYQVIGKTCATDIPENEIIYDNLIK